MTRGVFFDLYGTLILYADMPRAWADWESVFYQSLRTHGLDLSAADFSRRCRNFFTDAPPMANPDGLTVYERRISRICAENALKLNAEDVRRIATRTVEAWQLHLPPDPDAAPVLKHLASSGFLLALVTNFDHPPHVLTVLENAGIKDYFRTLVISGAVGVKKPDPAIFGLALGPSGLDADQVMFVGDAPEDVLGAHAAGMRPVLLRRASEPPQSRPLPKETIHIDRLNDLLSLLA